jgi:hypothetical protein
MQKVIQTNIIAVALLYHLEREARANKRETLTLTCKENLIRFYENPEKYASNRRIYLVSGMEKVI